MGVFWKEEGLEAAFFAATTRHIRANAPINQEGEHSGPELGTHTGSAVSAMAK